MFVKLGRPHEYVANAHCMLDTLSYKYTQRLCNNHGFSTATMVARTPLNFTLYVHPLYCCYLYTHREDASVIKNSCSVHTDFKKSYPASILT